MQVRPIIPSLDEKKEKTLTDRRMKSWAGDRTNTKNWGTFLRLNSNSLRLLQRQKEKEAGIPFSVSPNKQRADEKWEHKQAGEPRMCSPRSENVPLESETIFSERESWLDTKWVSQQHWEQSRWWWKVFSVSVFYHIHFLAVCIFFNNCKLSKTPKINLVYCHVRQRKSGKPTRSRGWSHKCLAFLL